MLLGDPKDEEFLPAAPEASSRPGRSSTSCVSTPTWWCLLADVPKDEALRAAQLELIHGGPVRVPDGQGGSVEKDFSSPYYWAAFQLIGDWR
jgi:hypothetical protein